MSSAALHELSKAVNAEARKQGPLATAHLGKWNLATSVLSRYALRANTPYPYSFTEDDSLLPKNDENFGRVIKRSREEGLREIHDSITDQQQEHGWLFVPKLSIWIDTTMNASETEVDFDRDGQVYLSHIFPEIESVHTHPDHTVRNLARTEPWSYSSNYLLEAALPSTDDLSGHSNMATRNAQVTRTTDSIVSHYGVTTFSANTIGLGEGYDVSPEPYKRIIEEPIDPIVAIRNALNALQSHYVRFDSDTPAFLYEFEALA